MESEMETGDLGPWDFRPHQSRKIRAEGIMVLTTVRLCSPSCFSSTTPILTRAMKSSQLLSPLDRWRNQGTRRWGTSQSFATNPAPESSLLCPEPLTGAGAQTVSDAAEITEAAWTEPCLPHTVGSASGHSEARRLWGKSWLLSLRTLPWSESRPELP